MAFSFGITWTLSRPHPARQAGSSGKMSTGHFVIRQRTIRLLALKSPLDFPTFRKRRSAPVWVQVEERSDDSPLIWVGFLLCKTLDEKFIRRNSRSECRWKSKRCPELVEEWRSQQAYLKASHTDSNYEFGYSLGFSGDGNILAVSFYKESSDATVIDGNQFSTLAPQSGAVYIFTRSGTNLVATNLY